MSSPFKVELYGVDITTKVFEVVVKQSIGNLSC